MHGMNTCAITSLSQGALWTFAFVRNVPRNVHTKKGIAHAGWAGNPGMGPSEVVVPKGVGEL